MHVHFLDPFRPRVSLIHALDARVKFVLTVVFILATTLLPVGAWSAYVLLFAMVLAAVILSDLGVAYVLKRSALALPFVLAALPVVFTTEGTSVATFYLGPWSLSLTQQGLERFASIAVKSWLSVQLAILLTASTSFPDLLLAMRAVKMPRLMVSIVGLTWRYIFVLADEALRLMRARQARSGRVDGSRAGGSLLWRARVTGAMAGSLLVRAFDRGERIYAAMASRGYDGDVRSFPRPALSTAERLVLAAGLASAAGLVLFGLLFST